MVSVAGIRLVSRKSVRVFKGIFCADIFEFESHMASQAVPSLRGNSGSRELAAARLRTVGAASSPSPAAQVRVRSGAGANAVTRAGIKRRPVKRFGSQLECAPDSGQF